MSRGVVNKPPVDLPDAEEHRIMIARYARSIDIPYGDNAPTNGRHVSGDRVLNNSPTAGGYVGWVCVASGDPGTWKQYGDIEA